LNSDPHFDPDSDSLFSFCTENSYFWGKNQTLDPDPHEMDADPKPCFPASMCRVADLHSFYADPKPAI